METDHVVGRNLSAEAAGYGRGGLVKAGPLSAVATGVHA
jgi:hypothetical protein